MRTFVCSTCGLVVEARGLQAWHRCQGRVRELRIVEPEPVEPPSVVSLAGQISLF